MKKCIDMHFANIRPSNDNFKRFSHIAFKSTGTFFKQLFADYFACL